MKTEYMYAYLVIEQSGSSNYYHDAFFDYEEAKKEVKRIQEDFPSSFVFIEDINIKCKEGEVK